MTWRVAKSLEKLRDQINVQWPERNKLSDGTIGDAAHSGTNSDHNPWVMDGSMGVVTALDITHDPEHGCDCNRIVNNLVASRDSRIKYIIWNSRIISSEVSPWVWRVYSGSNPHSKHFHLSVKSVKSAYDDTREWRIRQPVKQIRFELWAGHPATKRDESTWAKYPGRLRFNTFRARVALRMFRLTLKGQRPHFRRRTRTV